MKTKTIYHTNKKLEIVKIEKRISIFGIVIMRAFQNIN